MRVVVDKAPPSSLSTVAWRQLACRALLHREMKEPQCHRLRAYSRCIGCPAVRQGTGTRGNANTVDPGTRSDSAETSISSMSGSALQASKGVHSAAPAEATIDTSAQMTGSQTPCTRTSLGTSMSPAAERAALDAASTVTAEALTLACAGAVDAPPTSTPLWPQHREQSV